MPVRLSDYVFSFVAGLGVKDVFAVCGGGNMHLADALWGSKEIAYIATQNEQAAAMAAEAYSRITRNIGVALVTTGPGGTNAITGVNGAWIDSIPVVYISGQVPTHSVIGGTGLRQFGVQETDIVNLVKPITKYAVMVKDKNRIKYCLEKAFHSATTGRPGPVWIDIPLDIQGTDINPEVLTSFYNENHDKEKQRTKSVPTDLAIAECVTYLKKARRPVLISGYGIRLARAEEEFAYLVDKLGIPVVSSWNSSDLIPSDHSLYVGRSGIMGDRGSNFAVQNSDLLLIIGSRMSIPQVGYDYRNFAREAKKIMVDVDGAELRKPSIHVDLPIRADAKNFINAILSKLDDNWNSNIGEWISTCQAWKRKYPVVLPEYGEIKEKVNSFYFIDILSKRLDKNSVVVTDMGTSFTCTMQTFKTKLGQRLFTSSGCASMGFGLPGAIGACLGHGKKRTICISGDGGMQMNVQELQTLVHYKLPVILFVLNNSGYLTIKLMQKNHFGRLCGSDPSSGYSVPDFAKVAEAYGIKSERICNNTELLSRIDVILREPGPYLCEIMMDDMQELIPRASSLKKPDGSMVSKPLEDMYPFLDREEFFEEMIVTPLDE